MCNIISSSGKWDISYLRFIFNWSFNRIRFNNNDEFIYYYIILKSSGGFLLATIINITTITFIPFPLLFLLLLWLLLLFWNFVSVDCYAYFWALLLAALFVVSSLRDLIYEYLRNQNETLWMQLTSFATAILCISAMLRLKNFDTRTHLHTHVDIHIDAVSYIQTESCKLLRALCRQLSVSEFVVRRTEVLREIAWSR